MIMEIVIALAIFFFVIPLALYAVGAVLGAMGWEGWILAIITTLLLVFGT